MGEQTQKPIGCRHQTVWWKLDPCREAGWVCADCHEVLGFRPDLDRAQTAEKASSILHALHDGNLIYVSNGTQGDIIVQGVAERCHITGAYDQQTIIQFLLAHEEMAGGGRPPSGSRRRGGGSHAVDEPRTRRGRDSGDLE